MLYIIYKSKLEQIIQNNIFIYRFSSIKNDLSYSHPLEYSERNVCVSNVGPIRLMLFTLYMYMPNSQH